MARPDMKISPMPPTFAHPEYHYRSTVTPTITVSQPTPSGCASGLSAPSFRTVDISDGGEDQKHDATSSYKNILALTAATSFLNIVYQRAAAQYRAYNAIVNGLTSPAPASFTEPYLPLHHAPAPQQTEETPAPSIEEHLVEHWTGPDVRTVVGSTMYALATAREARYTPFAAPAGTGALLQGMYGAFRDEVLNVIRS